jgi:signal transduction histidine kinase
MDFFDPFMPHGYCLLWRPDILWTHVVSDAIITVAYYSIPLAIVYLLRARPELQYPIVGWLFSAFIVLCGTTHAVAIWVIWNGAYGLEALVKALTAAVSIGTAFVCWRLMPTLLSIPTAKTMEERVRNATAELAASNTKLAQANAELESFVAVASHDLKEPLRTMAAFSALLRSDLGDDLPEDARTDLDHITAASRRMQNLVQNLLDLTRTSRLDLHMDALSMDGCANAALKSMEFRIEESGARIVRDALPVVQGDKTLVTQIYQNLLGNALKFRREGHKPVIRLTAERVLDGEVVFGVADNGIGIEAEYRARIFEPFERLHSESQYEGAGIGLSICHRAVTRMGGRIWVEESRDGGSHFKFTLRAAQPAGASAERPLAYAPAVHTAG